MTAPLSRAFYLAVGGLLEEFLDWPAWSCRVENYTNQWLHLVGTLEYIRPGGFGVVVTVPGIPYAEAEFAAPPGETQPAAVPGRSARLVYYGRWMMPNPGALA